MANALPQLVWLSPRAPTELHARRLKSLGEGPVDAGTQYQFNRLDVSDRDVEPCLPKAPGATTESEWADQIVSCGIVATARDVESSDMELKLRAGPLRELWLTRGPGYLHQLFQQGADAVAPLRSRSEIPCVGLLPLRGGDGYVSHRHAGIALEWLLTNVDDQLPEVLRLAWLVTQLVIGAAMSPSSPLAFPVPAAPPPSATALRVNQVVAFLSAFPAWKPTDDEVKLLRATVDRQAIDHSLLPPTAVAPRHSEGNKSDISAVAAMLITLRLANELDWFPFASPNWSHVWRIWRLPLFANGEQAGTGH